MEKSFNLSLSYGDLSSIEGFDANSFANKALKLERLFNDILYSDLVCSKNLPESIQIATDLEFVDDQSIRAINKDFRGKDAATDVVSLALYENFKDLERENYLPVMHIGDVFISIDTAMRQAEKAKISLEQELIELMIHGILHLFGYDHELSDEQRDLMYSLERKIYKIYKELK